MGSGLIKTAVERPVGVIVGMLLIVMFGTLSLLQLPIQLTPDIQAPTLTVTTVWPGAAPQEVESEILERQEEYLKSLTGLEEMVSEARTGQGTITMELKVGTSIQEALVRASNLLTQVPQYPLGARQPVLKAANSAGPPLAVILIQANDSGSVEHWRTFTEEEVVPRIERVEGVASIRLVGGQDSVVEVEFDVSALAARGVSLSQLSQAITAELSNLSAGDLDIGKRRFQVRTILTPERFEELESIVIATDDDGTPIWLGDVAEVRVGLRKPSARVLGDGKSTLALLLFREAGSNVLEVTEEVQAAVQTIQAEQMESRELHIRVASDQTGYIYAALNLVQQNLLVGAMLAVVVLLVFLRRLGASAVVAIAIPVCAMGTALGMALMGRTINVVSMAGMAFAVGLVVDNAIVVLENIDTWRTRTRDTAEAAIEGTREVWGAILASTLTTAAVFIPILTWEDEVGQLLRDVSLAIATAVAISLVVSVLMIPSLAARLMSREKAQEEAQHTTPTSPSPIVRLAGGIRELIGTQVRWLVSSPLRSAAMALLAPALAIAVALALLPPAEYLPTGNRDLVFGIMIPPPGYSVHEMNAIGDTIQNKMLEHTGVEKDGVPEIARSFYVGDPNAAFMGAISQDPMRARELVPFMRSIFAQIPGVFGIATQASLFGRSVGGGRAVEINISGSDLAQMTALGGRMMGAVKGVIPNAQIRPIPSLDAGAPEFHVLPNRDQMAQQQLRGAELGLVVDALMDGAIIGEVGREGETKLDVIVKARNTQISDVADLRNAPVATPRGEVVPLETLATVSERLGPTVIRRLERRRSITLQVRPPDDVALEAALEQIRTNVVTQLESEGAIPEGISLTLTGTAGKLDLAKERFAWILALAVLISFLLMSALFEDFIAPIAVLVTVPLAAAGGLGGLWAVDRYLGQQPLDMLTFLGFIILIGVVVNNAILIVDGSIARLKSGEALDRAIVQSVESRVRPIFMSALTTLAGLLPLVVATGSGSELYRGIGSVVLGGLTLSTLLTLYVVPVLFATLWRIRSRFVARTP